MYIVRRGLMNVNLGAPYIEMIDEFIKKGYAGTRAEVIRHALRELDRSEYELTLNKEESNRIWKKIKASRAEIKSGKAKLIPFEQIQREFRD